MTNREYQIYLVTEVTWWADLNRTTNWETKESILQVYANVFGVDMIIEYTILKDLAKRLNKPAPMLLSGG